MSLFGTLLPILAAVATAPEVDGRFLLNLNPGNVGGGSVAVIEIFVAPDGKVDNCRVIASDYGEAGERRFCESARRMRVATPASDADGNPIHGFVTVSRIARPVGSNARAPVYREAAYLEIGVLDLPGEDTTKTVYVTAVVDAQGAVGNCQSANEQDRNYGQVACQQLREAQLPVLHDRNGVAVRYVKDLKVDFIEQPSGS